MRAMLEALSYVHRKGILHRDIKPSNILLADRPVLIDFGSGIALQTAITSRITTTAIGTPGFIAPEFLENPLVTHPSIDLYSLGVTCHYLMTNHLPYPSDVTHYLKAHQASDEMVKVIARSLLPLTDRYQSAEEMLADLPVIKGDET